MAHCEKILDDVIAACSILLWLGRGHVLYQMMSTSVCDSDAALAVSDIHLQFQLLPFGTTSLLLS